MYALSPNFGHNIKGRSLARQLRNGTAAERDYILRDLLSGKLIVTDMTKKQIEHVVAASLVGLPRPPDEKILRARRARMAARTIEKCGADVVMQQLDKLTEPELPMAMQAAE